MVILVTRLGCLATFVSFFQAFIIIVHLHFISLLPHSFSILSFLFSAFDLVKPEIWGELVIFDCVGVPLLSAPECFRAGWKEALVGRRSLRENREEGVVVLLDVQLQQVRGGQGLLTHRATVPVNCIVMGLRLMELTEFLAAIRHLATKLFEVPMQKLL